MINCACIFYGGETMAVINLEEAKQYMRIDDTDSDALIELLIGPAQREVQKIAGKTDEEFEELASYMKFPVLYTLSYMFEHREEADFRGLEQTLRALLARERITPC